MAYIGAGISRFNTADELTVTGDAQIDGTTLVVDSTNNRVGIGTSSPATATGGGIDIERGGGASVRIDDTTNSVTGEMQVYSAGMNLATVTNHNIIISTNNAEAMRIDSSGHVLVNNTAYGANGTLVVQQTADSKGIAIIDSAAANTFFLENDGTINRIRNNASVPLTLETASTERVRVDASGNVGIGTSSPNSYTGYTALTLNHATNGGIIDIERNGTLVGEIFTTDANTFTLAAVGAKAFTVTTNSTERMRILSGGDVAFGNSVANTVSNYNNQPGGGFVASDSHFEFATTSNRAPVEIGKNNANDGQLVVLRKQNTTVGSIQTKDSRLFISGSQGSTPAGIYFGGGGDVLPASTTNAVDNSISLGGTGHRWKNLFLSGGAYLGGTGSANLLDDYEEGDWTPTGNGQTLTNNFAKYRKIGSLVAIQAYIVFPTNSDTSGNANIAGLPFAGTQPSNAYGAFTVGYSDKGSSFTILKGNTTTDMDLRLHDGNNVKNADMSGKTLIFAGVYISV